MLVFLSKNTCVNINVSNCMHSCQLPETPCRQTNPTNKIYCVSIPFSFKFFLMEGEFSWDTIASVADPEHKSTKDLFYPNLGLCHLPSRVVNFYGQTILKATFTSISFVSIFLAQYDILTSATHEQTKTWNELSIFLVLTLVCWIKLSFDKEKEGRGNAEGQVAFPRFTRKSHSRAPGHFIQGRIWELYPSCRFISVL